MISSDPTKDHGCLGLDWVRVSMSSTLAVLFPHCGSILSSNKKSPKIGEMNVKATMNDPGGTVVESNE